MARTFKGCDAIKGAYSQRDEAKTVQAYRQALAVLLPLEEGLSLGQTAKVLGLSRGATSRTRNQFLAQARGQAQTSESRYKKVLPQRQAKEAAVLDEVLASAAEGGVVVVPPLKALVEAKLGRKICLATLYNMLHRHGWRKLAPDTKHPKGSVQAGEDWKKNSATSWKKFANVSRKNAPYA